MNITTKYFKRLAIACLTLIGLNTSCNNDNNPESPYVNNGKAQTILIYAVASNNLEGNLTSDKSEILSCASFLDLENNRLLLYEVTTSYHPALYELVKGADGAASFEKLKEYSTDISSLSYERFSEVINDMELLGNSSSYGLVLWSHGTGVDYYPDPLLTRSSGLTQRPLEYAFGYDRDPASGNVTEINIDALADAIPDGVFNFIWFDACYMSGIETIYELRNKCAYFVGYPTEVFEGGLPYDRVMPYILRPVPDLAGGAEAFFKYYANNSNNALRVATVAVIDMERLERVADLCREVYRNNYTVNTSQLQRYTRSNIGPFFDFNGYTLQKATDYDDLESWREKWNEALDDLIIYKATTDYDFNYNFIDKDQFCGISTHIYEPNADSETENFYRNLDWFQRVY